MRWLEYVVFLALVLGLAHPVGLYLVRVFERKPTFLDPALRPTESLLYRCLGVYRSQEMTAGVYILCFLFLSAVGEGRFFASAACPTLAPWRTCRSLPDHANDRSPGCKHRNQFFDDYNLAGVWRRVQKEWK